jgi:hypothetical protein
MAESGCEITSEVAKRIGKLVPTSHIKGPSFRTSEHAKFLKTGIERDGMDL